VSRSSDNSELDRPQRLHNPLSGQPRAFAWGTLICAAAAAALLANGGFPVIGAPSPPGTLAAFFAVLVLSGLTMAGGLALPILVREARRNDRELAGIERGEFLAHWTYRSDEWQAFVRAEFADARRFRWTMTIVLAIGGLLVGAGAAAEDWAAGTRGAVFLGVLIGSALCGSGVDWLVHLRALRRCRRLQQGPAEAYFGCQGVYFNGDYRRYTQRGQWLRAIDLLPERTPHTLVLTFRVLTRGGYMDQMLRLPVPAGQEQSAQRLTSCLK
jgi:hypothetical protein